MRKQTDGNNYYLIHDDGSIHYPFSKYVTDHLSNPNTRDIASKALRIFYRFCNANQIEIALRAIELRCLTYDECIKLKALCFRPITETENSSDRKVRHITSAKTGRRPLSLASGVEPNTASNRLQNIANYLEFYLEVFLLPHIRVQTHREAVAASWKASIHRLRNFISGTKQGHHLSIQSLQSDRFLEIIEAIFTRPNDLFLTKSGKLSRTLKRDRAIVLLACEGLRPGTIGNVGISDYRPDSGILVIKDNRQRRKKVSTSTPLLKLGASTTCNSGSEGMIKLWPFTVEAIREYVEIERQQVQQKKLKNKSNGFLFLNQMGGPLSHRSILTSIFRRLGDRLAEIGLLDISNDPYFWNQKHYDFYAYVLRHSSVTLFAEINGIEPKSLDAMKVRYGWTTNSLQPQRYAARAMSDRANIDLMSFNARLMAATKS